MQRLATAGPAAVLYLTAAATLSTTTAVLSITAARSSNTDSCRHPMAPGVALYDNAITASATGNGVRPHYSTWSISAAISIQRPQHINLRLKRSTKFKFKIPRATGCCRPCVSLFCCHRRRRRNRCKLIFCCSCWCMCRCRCQCCT
ncbi:hypothetical protein JKP88DRAFT_253895 [Tribonema minus]|uniref:Secreted protein n=1 Tax=Tribonema minus TaxID=303371 RepID=A0A836CJL5_9STRA|nr:hypothetical protein JKP88DRAFT_253895 [Tribonema minus]